jgi:hypothetical protein
MAAKRPPIDYDSETGDYYEVTDPPTKTDYVVGGLWCLWGIGVLAFYHVRDRFKVSGTY